MRAAHLKSEWRNWAIAKAKRQAINNNNGIIQGKQKIFENQQRRRFSLFFLSHMAHFDNGGRFFEKDYQFKDGKQSFIGKK